MTFSKTVENDVNRG